MKKCAIYTRVSTTTQAEKEYSSCEAQKDRITSFIQSQEDMEIFKEYADPGFTGGDLERPALNELLRDIESGKVDLVLTYKIDRLTRSSKDFYALIEFFDKHKVSYISVTERFDTASPSGRLLRNIMLTFAQFEREMTSERIKDKFEQRAIKGLWNGGIAPFGYKRENKKLVADKSNAKCLREIFETFVETGSFKSVMDVVRQKEFKNTNSKHHLSECAVYHILRNPVYIGKVVWNNKVYEGIHEPLVSEELFSEAQGLTREKLKKKRLYKEYQLARLVKCGDCGSSMTNTFTNKKTRRYYYYKCIKVVKEGSGKCSLKEINAEKLEAFIFESLERVSKDRPYIESLVYKTLRTSPDRIGFELTPESEKKQVETVVCVLNRYASLYRSGSQLEKLLINKKTIQKINLSKESLEVIVSLIDTSTPKLTEGLGTRLKTARVGLRGDAVNSDVPACSTTFESMNGGESRIRTYGALRHSSFQDCRNRPLCHLSSNRSVIIHAILAERKRGLVRQVLWRRPLHACRQAGAVSPKMDF